MTPLPIRFSRSTFTYRQVCRFGNVALYRKHPIWGKKPPELEVIKAREVGVPITNLMGPLCQYEGMEFYPYATDYGKRLFPASDEADAFGIMAALLLV